jgi:FkbM family methyltransferase
MENNMRRWLIGLVQPIVKHFPNLLMLYRFMRHNYRIQEVPAYTSMGFKMIGSQSMQEGKFEPEETEIARTIIPNADIVINVGANIGYYCCLALSYGKYVVAFEPINFNFQYLLRNIKANSWESQIEAFPIALSNQPGIIEIYGDGVVASLVKGWADTPEQYATLVPCSTLDNTLGSRFNNKKCFIIVDIEGAELLMLKGANSFICQEPKPIWMMEISISELQPKGISINPNLLSTFQFFWNNGYESWTADKRCQLVHPDEIENIVISANDTLGTHNFLFIEQGKKKDFFGA